MTIKISNKEDRRMIAGILVENGYKVSVTTIKIGKISRTVLVVEDKEEKEVSK